MNIKLLVYSLLLIISIQACSDVTLNEVTPQLPDSSDTLEIPPIVSKQSGIMVNIAADAFAYISRGGVNISSMNKEQAETILDQYIDSFTPEGHQVRAILLNVNYQRSCFENSVMETYWDIKDVNSNIKDWPKTIWQIQSKGIDIYELSINRIRKNKAEAWISVRMNDHHYFNDSLKINKFWLSHKELHLTQSQMFDFGYKEVRNYYKSYILEVLKRYDVDGIELDWMRTFNLFKPGKELQGGIMLDQFMKEIKEIVDSTGISRGHRIKIGVRVPPSPSVAKTLGINGVKWAQSNYVDVLVATNWYRPTNFNIPIEDWKKQIGLSDCDVLAGADQAFSISNDKYAKNMVTTAESMRGFAVGAYQRGADGIYLFNNNGEQWYRYAKVNGKNKLVDDKKTILSEIGKNTTLLEKPKSFVYTFTHPDVNRLGLSFSVPILPLQNSIENTYNIYTGGVTKENTYYVRVGIDESPTSQNAKIQVLLNGSMAEEISDLERSSIYYYDKLKTYQDVWDLATVASRVLQFKINSEQIKNGYNQINLKNLNQGEEKILWLEIYSEK